MSTWMNRVGTRLGLGSKARTVAPWLVQAALLVGVASSTTGCGALGALANPKAAWAFDESAPMSVVVRRAEIANATAKQVERLMGKSGVDDTSVWIPRTAMKKADAEALLADIGATNDTYKSAQGAKVRVVPAEAWYASFSGICSSEQEHPNLLAATSPVLGNAYQDIAKLQDEIAKLNTKKAAEDAALDKDGLSDAEKAEHEKKIEELDASIDKLEDTYEPKLESFIAKVREESGKADAATKKRVGVAVVNLRRAVEDAKLNNSVAMIRYPLAIGGLVDDVQSTAKRVLADVIEEKTGTRPDMSSLKPDVQLDGLDVKLTINGLTASQIGGMSPEEVIEETTLRLVTYVGRVGMLVAYVDETQQLLDFQTKVLDAWIEGLKIDPANTLGAGDDLAELEITTGGPAGKKVDKAALAMAGQSLGKHTPAGLRTASCKVPAKSEAPVTAQVEEPPAAKGSSAKAGKASGGGVAAAKSIGGGSTAPASVSEVPKSTKSSNSGATTNPAGPATPSGNKPCDVVVTNAEGSFCL